MPAVRQIRARPNASRPILKPRARPLMRYASIAGDAPVLLYFSRAIGLQQMPLSLLDIEDAERAQRRPVREELVLGSRRADLSEGADFGEDRLARDRLAFLGE